MSSRPVAAVVAALVGLTLWASRPEADPVAPAHLEPLAAVASSDATLLTSAAPPATSVDLDLEAPQLRRRDRLARANTRTPMRVAPVAHGIRCPDGTFLPLLNGVASAPAIIREPERGPLPAVVAVLVDADGFEWYEHADASVTTSRPQRVTDQHGVSSIQTVTLHVTHNQNGARAAVPEPTSHPALSR